MCIECGCWGGKPTPDPVQSADQSPKGIPVTVSPLAAKGK